MTVPLRWRQLAAPLWLVACAPPPDPGPPARSFAPELRLDQVREPVSLGIGPGAARPTVAVQGGTGEALVLVPTTDPAVQLVRLGVDGDAWAAHRVDAHVDGALTATPEGWLVAITTDVMLSTVPVDHQGHPVDDPRPLTLLHPLQPDIARLGDGMPLLLSRSDRAFACIVYGDGVLDVWGRPCAEPVDPAAELGRATLATDDMAFGIAWAETRDGSVSTYVATEFGAVALPPEPGGLAAPDLVIHGDAGLVTGSSATEGWLQAFEGSERGERWILGSGSRPVVDAAGDQAIVAWVDGGTLWAQPRAVRGGEPLADPAPIREDLDAEAFDIDIARVGTELHAVVVWSGPDDVVALQLRWADIPSAEP